MLRTERGRKARNGDFCGGAGHTPPGCGKDDHVEWSSASTKPSDTGLNNIVPYPEEYQAYCVEQYAGSALALTWPVFNLYGAVFDYAASNVTTAGGKSGVMQTGLVTRDRSVIKDAYYFLKAMWNSEPMVHITQKRNMDKEYSPVTLRIYTNCAYVKVYSSSMTLLDTIQRTSGSYVVTKSVELEEGSNVFYVTGHSTSSGEATCNDNVTIDYEDTSGTVHVVIYSDNAIVNSGKLAAKVIPLTEPQGVTWTSLDTDVATVDSSGNVTVVSDGTVSFRATSTSDNTVTKVKSIPCFVKGNTDSLYYKAALTGDCYSPYTQYGLTVTNNHDGTTTINGTLTNKGGNKFFIFPNGYSGGKSNMNSQICTILVPPWGFTGDQLLTAEIVGGTITGSYSGTPITLIALDPTYTDIAQLVLKPLNDVADGEPVKAKLISGSTLGISGFRFALGYENGTVFDNVVLRVQSFKSSSGTYYDGGILENHFVPVGTVAMFGKNDNNDDHCNMFARNANGSFTITIGNPNAGYGIRPTGRLTGSFTAVRGSVPVTGSTIAEVGDVVKFTAIMLNWPGHYVQKEEGSQFSFKAWYADGSDAATLRWAYGANGDGVDFTGGTASTTFLAEKVVDCVGWRFTHMSWGGNLDATEAVTFALKMELLDPTEIPPSSVTAYGSTRIVNTGQLNATCSPVSANQSVTWSSSNTSVATVDSNTGKVTVVADGSCTFTATSTLDNTRSGSVTVSCLKITDENMAANISASTGTSSITVSGVTVTDNGDGTFELNGTVSSTASTNYNLGPLNTSSSQVFAYFLPITIDGDVLVWFEHLSGTVSEASTLTGKDFEVQVYDLNNSKINDYSLNYQEYPTSNGESQCKLITGSTAGIKRFNIASKRPANTVFTNYLFRIGIKKLSQAGLVYSGGVIESSLLAVYKYASVERLRFARLPNGAFFVYLTTTGNYWTSNKTYGCFRLTSGVAYAASASSVLTGNSIAPSGKTYKFTFRLLEALSFTAGDNLSFSVMSTSGGELAKITVLSNGALSSDIDANGVCEKTFTATAAVDAVYLGFSNVKLSDSKMHFAVSLTEVTT